MQPIQMTVTGTTVSTAVLPDYMQNPFDLTVACIAGAAAVTFSVEHTFNFSTVFGLPTWDGSTGVTWFTNASINGATTSIQASYNFPIAALRVRIASAVATSTVTMIVAQATNAP
jgi:hypothetical protein